MMTINDKIIVCRFSGKMMTHIKVTVYQPISGDR